MVLDSKKILELVAFIDELLGQGKWVKNQPKYSTYPTLHTYELFKPMCEELITLSSERLKNPSINMMWCYVDYKDSYLFYESRSFWHCHNNCITALLYLQNPERIGTEFTDGSFVFPAEAQWILMDGLEYHRPPTPFSNQRRYTIAANLDFDEMLD